MSVVGALAVVARNVSLILQPSLTFDDPVSITAADLNRDGNGDSIPDIASSASFLDKVSVFVGQGNGNFAASVDFALPVGSSPLGQQRWPDYGG